MSKMAGASEKKDKSEIIFQLEWEKITMPQHLNKS